MEDELLEEMPGQVQTGAHITVPQSGLCAKHEGRQISRKMVISPMVDDRARPVAQALGIEVYSYADEVEGL
jgi:hypothetical protein